VHLPGYLLIPHRLVIALSATVDAHLALLEKALSRDFRKSIRSLMHMWTSYIDFMSAELLEHSLNSTKNAAVKKLRESLNINEVFYGDVGGFAILNQMLDPKSHYKPAEKDRKAITEVLDEKKADPRYSMTLSKDDLGSLAEEVYDRLRSEYQP